MNSKIIACILLFSNALLGQNDSVQLERKIIKNYTLGSLVFISATDVALYHAWYKDYATGSFHFFDDHADWLQIDKVGHSFSAYQIQRASYQYLTRGVEGKKALWYSSSASLAFLLGIEVMDGFSEGWGASTSDLIANFSGIGLFTIQQAVFHKQMAQLKWSYSPTHFASYRPNLLGSSGPERALKDYNGQTYWLSIGLRNLAPKSKIPDWLCVSLGYGASGMLGGSKNPLLNEQNQVLPNYVRTRQYYLSLDLDLTKIKSKYTFVRTLFFLCNTIKIPFPALRLENGKVYGEWFGF